MKQRGVVLEFEGGAYGIGVADVSWISKFPSEKEWLKSGSRWMPHNVQSVEVVDGHQRVVLG